MATRKTATAKKPAKRAPAAKKTTKVTTVRAASAARTDRWGGFTFSRSPLLAASVAEFVGTFLLAAVYLVSQGSATAVLFGLLAIVLAVGAVSGAHVNPAITVGAWVTRRINSARAVSFLVAQVLGAMLALVVLNGFVSAAPAPDAQQAMFGQQAASLFSLGNIPDGKEWLILAAELLGTGILAWAFASATRERGRLTAAFTIAGGLFVGLAVAGYCSTTVGGSNAVLNPAVAGSLQAIHWQLWPIMVYVVAPLVGGVVGWALNDLVSAESRARA